MTELTQRLNEVDPELVARKKKQIAGLRYKVYIFICVVGVLFFWGIFVGEVEKVRGLGAIKLGEVFSEGPVHVFLESRGEGGILNAIANTEASISGAIDEVAEIQEIQEIIVELNTTGKQYTLANCINNNICNDIKPKLMESLPFFRTYIILNSLQAPKMDFDQKYIIKSVLEYLLKSPTSTGTGNGTLLGITFGEPVEIDAENHLFRLSVGLEVAFADKDSFLQFLVNVEDKIHFLMPILYKIEGVNYSIVDYKYPQTLTINMSAYYYTPPEIKKKVEAAGTGDTLPPPA